MQRFLPIGDGLYCRVYQGGSALPRGCSKAHANQFSMRVHARCKGLALGESEFGNGQKRFWGACHAAE